MIDPVLSGFDMPLLIEVPITEAQVPHLDGILFVDKADEMVDPSELEEVSDSKSRRGSRIRRKKR